MTFKQYAKAADIQRLISKLQDQLEYWENAELTAIQMHTKGERYSVTIDLAFVDVDQLKKSVIERLETEIEALNNQFSNL